MRREEQAPGDNGGGRSVDCYTPKPSADVLKTQHRSVYGCAIIDSPHSADMQPEAIVRAFCSAWEAVDVDRIVTMLAPDAVYQNGPARPVLHLATSGDIVFTERRDVVTVGDTTAVLPVVGVFEVRGGMIQEWREYFDHAMHMSALGI